MWCPERTKTEKCVFKIIKRHKYHFMLKRVSIEIIKSLTNIYMKSFEFILWLYDLIIRD